LTQFANPNGLFDIAALMLDYSKIRKNTIAVDRNKQSFAL